MYAWLRPTPVPRRKKPKKVRFAYQNTFYSPLQPAVSSLPPSVPTTITPPSTGYGLPGPSPYAFSYPPRNPPMSMQYPGSIRVHPVLDRSAVNYDLIEHPSTIVTHDNYSLSIRTFREPATTPPRPFLTITSIHLPWIVKVYASNGVYVTVEDVFDSIYRTLRTNITGTEFNLLSKQDDQRRATRTYEKRYRRLRANTVAYDAEKRGGMKRVDFLMGHTKFLGLSSSSHRPDEWQLLVG